MPGEVQKTPENIERAAMMRIEDGKSWKTIAQEIVISDMTLYRWRQCKEFKDLTTRLSHEVFKQTSVHIVPTLSKAERELFTIAQNDRVPAKDRVAALQTIIDSTYKRQEIIYNMALTEENEAKIQAMYELMNTLNDPRSNNGTKTVEVLS